MTPGAAPAGRKTAGVSAWLMLGLLMLGYLLSMVDRMVIGLLTEPIKASLGLSDTQMGLLQGLAFLLIYSIVGLPLGLLVDRVNRLRLIAGSVILWSVMTGLCGLATSFPLLFAARTGVGIGEAALGPGAYSLIAGAFPRQRLALALGIYGLGAAAGSGFALLVGGAVYGALSQMGPLSLGGIPLEPWQATFLVVALPGLPLAMLIAMLREPAREPLDAKQPTGWPAIRAYYRKHRRLVLFQHLGTGCLNLTSIGMLMWVSAMFGRVHGWSIAQTGLVTGPATLLAGLVGLVAGGFMSDRLVRRWPTIRLKLCSVACVAGAAFGFLFGASPSAILSACAMGLYLACNFFAFNCGNAALQSFTPDRMRGFASAVFLLVISLVSSLGPLTVAALTQYVFTTPAGIGQAMAVFSATGMLAAALFYALGSAPYGRAVRANDEAVALGAA